jgi:organic hydroperoxide reductase OsmC/OhrA
VTATATGAGRKGRVEAADFRLKMDSPSELGGAGEGQNPEQLYAMGYACKSF